MRFLGIKCPGKRLSGRFSDLSFFRKEGGIHRINFINRIAQGRWQVFQGGIDFDRLNLCLGFATQSADNVGTVGCVN